MPKAARKEPTPSATSHIRRQRAVEPLPRHSIDTARKINPSSTKTSGT